MIRFLPISVLILFFVGCATARFPNHKSHLLHEKTQVNNYFIDTATLVSYRASIEFGTQQFSGTLIIRTYHNDLRRFALLSDLGQTLFDFSIFKDHHVVNSMLPALDKKIVTNELANLFRMMTQPYEAIRKIQTDNAQEVYYEVNIKNRKNYYHYVYSRLKRIEQHGIRRPRFTIEYDGSANYPANILLLHNRFPLRISLILQNDNL